jgi:hypothetical protein
LKQTRFGSNYPIQKRRFTLVGALSSNPINKTYELDNNHSSTIPSCLKLFHVEITTCRMGNSPIENCPTLYVNDVDEDQEATKHKSLFKVAISSSIDEEDPNFPSIATTHVQSNFFCICSLLFSILIC